MVFSIVIAVSLSLAAHWVLVYEMGAPFYVAWIAAIGIGGVVGMISAR